MTIIISIIIIIIAIIIVINTSAKEAQLFLTSRKCKWAAHTG